MEDRLSAGPLCSGTDQEVEEALTIRLLYMVHH